MVAETLHGVIRRIIRAESGYRMARGCWQQHRRPPEGGRQPQTLREDELDAAHDHRPRVWEAAGWTVHRLTSDDLDLRPARLLAIAPAPAPVAVAAARAPAPPAA
ncbi:MAG TPA: hypothetical protein VLB47_01865, partial [Solirubrobacteraceae bacterium]|nr:hypothetical protein [Solirubrobacteraceae bacterium]